MLNVNVVKTELLEIRKIVAETQKLIDRNATLVGTIIAPYIVNNDTANFECIPEVISVSKHISARALVVKESCGKIMQAVQECRRTKFIEDWDYLEIEDVLKSYIKSSTAVLRSVDCCFSTILPLIKTNHSILA